MPKKQSKAFSASQVQKPPPAGGQTVPGTEFIKTTLILRRQEGGARQQDVGLVYNAGPGLGPVQRSWQSHRQQASPTSRLNS